MLVTALRHLVTEIAPQIMQAVPETLLVHKELSAKNAFNCHQAATEILLRILDGEDSALAVDSKNGRLAIALETAFFMLFLIAKDGIDDSLGARLAANVAIVRARWAAVENEMSDGTRKKRDLDAAESALANLAVSLAKVGHYARASDVVKLVHILDSKLGLNSAIEQVEEVRRSFETRDDHAAEIAVAKRALKALEAWS